MKENEEAEVIYEKSNSHVTIPANMGFGGISPNGSNVVLNLINEQVTIPSFESFKVQADGKVDLKKGKRVARGNITREILATVFLPPETAVEIGQWLTKQGKLALKARTKKGNN